MMMKSPSKSQIEKFTEAAEALAADASEANFNAALRKVGDYKPPPKPAKARASKKPKPAK